MIFFPNCKLNLGLNILQKREDGYHDIETFFFPLPFYDALEIVTSDTKSIFTNTGISGGDAADNLCMKAYQLLKNDYPQLPEVKIHLHKTIPAGAGLGGGSADAAFTILLLHQKYNLPIPQNKLFEYALLLGSDCPYFLLNKPAFATGRGEILEGINLSLSDYKILIVNPGIHISTKELFAEISPVIPAKRIRQIIMQPVQTWKNELTNDFEMFAFSKYPSLQKIKERMYDANAIYSSMTGTGSTIYGLFKVNEKIDFNFAEEYFHKWICPD